MKTEDFNRLKAVCEKEGFELLNESPEDNDKFFVVKKIEPFKATYIDWLYKDNGMEVNLTFKIPNYHKVQDKDDIGEYIAEQLTKYLNEREN